MTTDTCRAWGILLAGSAFDASLGQPGPGAGLMGIFMETWKAPDRVADPRPRIALYPTREAARDTLRRLKLQESWPGSRVVRLAVTVAVDDP